MKVELRKLKVVKALSRETTCFTAELVLDGAVAGTVENRGDGGCNHYRFVDRAVGAAFKAHCREVGGPGAIEPDDALVGRLMDQVEVEKRLRRMCRKETLFQVPGDEAGSYRTVNAPFDAAVRAFILGKYPNADIVNERFTSTGA